MSGPKLATAPEPVKATLVQMQEGLSGPVMLAGRTSQLSAVGRYLGNRRFSSLLTGGEQSEFDIAFAEFSAPAQSLATPATRSTVMQTIEGKAALGTRAEVQLVWEPYAGEAFWPLGAGETTKSWLPSIARESWFNKRKGEAPSAGNDFLVCKRDPGGDVQVFKVILTEQKAVAEREFLKTSAISSSLITNVAHNIETLEKREAAPNIDPEEREVLRRTIGVLKATQRALVDPEGKTALPAEIQFELTNLGGAGDQFGIGNKASHLRILGRSFGKQGTEGRLLEDIIDHTVVRDRALATRLRNAKVLGPAAADPDVVPMRLLLTPQASAWLALRSGLTPEAWLSQQKKAAGKAAADAETARLTAEALARLQKQAPAKGKSPMLTGAQKKEIGAAAQKARVRAEKQAGQAWNSTGSVADSLAPEARSPADFELLERREEAARKARAAAEAGAAEVGASRTDQAHQLLLLARSEEVKARLALAEARAERSGSKADIEAARQLRAEFARGAQTLNEMGEVARQGLEFQQFTQTARPGPPTVIVAEPAPAPATRPGPAQPRYTAQRGQPLAPMAQGGPSPVGEAVGGIGQLLADLEKVLSQEAAYRNARKSQSLRTLHWWLMKGVRPQARGVTDRWGHFEMVMDGLDWVSAEDERVSDLREIVVGANEGRFDGIELDAPSRSEQYEAFERWVRANVHTLEDFYLHFVHTMDPGVRWNWDSDTFEVVAWAWGDMPPANVSETWTVDPRIDKFMHGIKAEIFLHTRQEIAGRSQADPRLGASGEFKLVPGERRFKTEGFIDPGFRDPQNGFEYLQQRDSRLVFREIAHAAVPAGTALVTGADLRTYLFILELRARYGPPADTGDRISSGGSDRLPLPTPLPGTGWKGLRLPVVLVNRNALQ